jgi:HlyD family secretion protein
MRNKIYWAILLAIVLAGSVYYYTTAATVVELTAVAPGNILSTVTDTGYVQAADKIDIYATQGGRIISLPVSVGQTVAKGQVLMVIGNQDLAISDQQLQIQLSVATAALTAAQAAVQQGNVDLADMQAQFNRDQQLYNAGAMSQVDFNAARSLLDKTLSKVGAQQQTLQDAQVQVNISQSLLNNSQQKEQELQIRSPISGTLMQLPVQPQETVAYGTLVADVASADDLEIKTDLLSDDMRQVQLGQKVQITAPVLGEQVLSGEVVQIYPQAEEEQSALGVTQRRVPTIIRLDSNGNLKAGFETQVAIITASKNDVLLVPRTAVLTAANGQKQVMLIVNGRVKYQQVTTGLTDSANVEITGGLNNGDQIVKDASVTLAANTRVKAK